MVWRSLHHKEILLSEPGRNTNVGENAFIPELPLYKTTEAWLSLRPIYIVVKIIKLNVRAMKIKTKKITSFTKKKCISNQILRLLIDRESQRFPQVMRN